jgi:hydroxyethylthiazole kinase-like uncharacterized protein yjeF
MPLPDHDPRAGKDGRGRLLVVAGSPSLPGGALLPATAALRVGCGIVRAAVPSEIAVALGLARPELMVVPLPTGQAGRAAIELLEEQLELCGALVLGPGLVEARWSDRLLGWLLERAARPAVVDARALYLWPGHAGHGVPAPRVLTPHARELAALLGRDRASVEAERETVATAFAREHGVTLVAKGAETLIADPGGHLFRNRRGTSGLGTAGSGDVLAGVIGGLLAQGVAAREAAVWGVHTHALAGEAAARDLGDDGMIASDLLIRLPNALRELRRRSKRS